MQMCVKYWEGTSDQKDWGRHLWMNSWVPFFHFANFVISAIETTQQMQLNSTFCPLSKELFIEFLRKSILFL